MYIVRQLSYTRQTKSQTVQFAWNVTMRCTEHTTCFLDNWWSQKMADANASWSFSRQFFEQIELFYWRQNEEICAQFLETCHDSTPLFLFRISSWFRGFSTWRWWKWQLRTTMCNDNTKMSFYSFDWIRRMTLSAQKESTVHQAFLSSYQAVTRYKCLSFKLCYKE